MRIIAGTARGRRLEGPPRGADIRPTADRVRESLFNILGQWLEGMTVLDLYAGTGALALEALSRGAVHAVLVDRDRDAIALGQRNAAALGFTAQVETLTSPAKAALDRLAKAGRKFAVVFSDPPYAVRGVEETLAGVGALLEPDGTLCLEHDKREAAPESAGLLSRVDQRRFGDTVVSLYRFA
jgi:16S rRNA (guanine966-N2)-methyltransferase